MYRITEQLIEIAVSSLLGDKIMTWELIKTDDTVWIQDDSGLYALIHYVKPNTVRLDIMTNKDEPVISFQGKAENIRKHAARYLQGRISAEHAAYIGCELARAELLHLNYVQD